MTTWHTCACCGRELTNEWFHVDGEDYCSGCQQDIPRRPGVWDETARGIIIGHVAERHYVFICDGRRIDGGEFPTDGAAIGWFKRTHPDLFATGAEMRVYE